MVNKHNFKIDLKIILNTFSTINFNFRYINSNLNIIDLDKQNKDKEKINNRYYTNTKKERRK